MSQNPTEFLSHHTESFETAADVGRQFACPMKACSETFQSFQTLRRHLKIHEKDHKCQRCGLVFSWKGDWIKHTKICLSQRNNQGVRFEDSTRDGPLRFYFCPLLICDAYFHSKLELNRHLASHCKQFATCEHHSPSIKMTSLMHQDSCSESETAACTDSFRGAEEFSESGKTPPHHPVPIKKRLGRPPGRKGTKKSKRGTKGVEPQKWILFKLADTTEEELLHTYSRSVDFAPFVRLNVLPVPHHLLDPYDRVNSGEAGLDEGCSTQLPGITVQYMYQPLLFAQGIIAKNLNVFGTREDLINQIRNLEKLITLHLRPEKKIKELEVIQLEIQAPP